MEDGDRALVVVSFEVRGADELGRRIGEGAA